MLRRAAFLSLILGLGLAAPGHARSHHRNRSNAEASFDYYLLSLSYAPDFCDQPNGNKDPRECGAGRHVGFVVHGLWPQAEEGRGPEHCGSGSPASQDLIRIMLNYYPTESLIQHEWTSHGTCTGLSTADYFSLVRTVRDSVKLPSDLQSPQQQLQLPSQTIEIAFSRANPTFPPGAFRAACYRGGELEEMRVCFDKNGRARACGASAGACPTGQITVLPVR